MLRTPRGAVLGTAASPRPWPSGCCRHPARPHRRPTDTRLEPAYKNATCPRRSGSTTCCSQMTLAEKVGQMTQAERIDVDADPSVITTYAAWAACCPAAARPRPATRPRRGRTWWTRFQAAALETRLGIPLLYGVDSVHGHGNLLGATVFPHNIGLGATRDPGLVKKIGHITAMETRATGPQWAFAPCVCVARDDRWGRTYESFGEDPWLVIRWRPIIDGLQGGPGELDHAGPGAGHRQALRR